MTHNITGCSVLVGSKMIKLAIYARVYLSCAVQDIFNNPIHASDVLCQLNLKFSRALGGNITQHCILDEDDASALKAILFATVTGMYDAGVDLQQLRHPVISLEGTI